MRMLTFAKRCTKEILRDPLNIIFGLGFPIVILLLLTAIQKNIPVDLFKLENLTPGITIFGLSFMTLFSATLIAKDRETAFIQRLYTTPLKASDYILGYMLPLIPLSILQTIICYIVAIIIGLDLSINLIYAILMIIPISIFYILLGLLCGTIFNVKQVGGICGALLTNISAWLSGIWFDLNLIGSSFKFIAEILPFYHYVEIEKALFNANFELVIDHIYPVIIYMAILLIFSIIIFLKKMKKQ